METYQVNSVTTDSEFRGEVKTSKDMRIDGNFIGNIFSQAKVVVSQSGQVTGDIHCNEIILMGKIQGNIISQTSISIMKPAEMIGNISCRQLSIEEGSLFRGECNFLETVNKKS